MEFFEKGGFRMRDWQSAIMAQDVSAMWEADAAAEWERLNAPDQYEKPMLEAAKPLKEAVGFLNIALDRLLDASAALSETPLQAKIDSFFEQVESIKVDLGMIQKKWERGERE
jgi:hypothetical protein